MEQNIRVLSASDMAAISQNLASIRSSVPTTKLLKASERRSLFKLSDNRLEFVEQAFKKMQSNPSLVPNYVDVSSAIRLLHLYKQLDEISVEFEKVMNQVENTRLQAGNQALKISKLFYHNALNAATIGLQDAEKIIETLKPLYAVGRNAKQKKKMLEMKEENITT